MKYIVHTIGDYVSILELSNDGIEVPQEILESSDLICYKYINGKFIFDEEKKKMLDQEEENRLEIETLKKKLTETDYIWNVIQEGDRTKEYYEDIIAQRHEWRLRIRELEESIGTNI